MPMSTFHKIAGNTSKRMSDKAMSQIASMYEENVTCKAVHILFHWNAHSFFTYHQDQEGHISVIINLSPSDAYMHVAGCETAKYNGIGSGHFFPSNVFHRSGDAPRRCVKVAIFYALEKPQDVDEGGSSGVTNEEKKNEVKTEEKTGVKTEEKGLSAVEPDAAAPSPEKKRERKARAAAPGVAKGR